MRHLLAATGSPITDERRSTLLRQISEQGGFSYVTSAEQAAAGDIRAAEAAREMAWEQLHAGPWHEVIPAWRDAYAMSCLHVADLRVAGDPREALRVLDMGFIMGGTLLHRDLDAAVKRIESGSDGGGDPWWEKKLSEVVSVLPRRSLSYKAVEKRDELLSMESFVCYYFLKIKPVVITGCIDQWPARTRWKHIKYLKRIAGERTVTVEIQEFRQDIMIPDYCFTGGGELQSLNAWFGPPGTVTPLHPDPHHNLFAQIFQMQYDGRFVITAKILTVSAVTNTMLNPVLHF